MRERYRAQGLRGLVDGRTRRPVSRHGRTDERVIAALREALGAETSRSTGTAERLHRRVEAILAERHGAGEVTMPSRTTFYRLVNSLSAGKHTLGAATTRRSAANRPEGPFTATWAARPGQQVQIDSTPLDVMAVFDDGHARRVELTAAVDVATRTLCAVILTPTSTKAVDASLLLARMLVPEPMRPGWAETMAMSRSLLPHRRLADIDARMEHAAAKPVIVPESITVDRGAIYESATFRRSCELLGISLQPARPDTPTDKGIIERTLQSVNTLFCQHVAGYTGRAASHRGRDVEAEACWSLAQLQELLEEWVIAGWQTRPHSELTGPDTGRPLSPNEMFAVLVAAAGYVPVMLTGTDYIELLPATWRTINDYGVRIERRTYDAQALNPLRRQHSGVHAQNGKWEIRYDPYDLSQVWIRNHHDLHASRAEDDKQRGEFIRAVWTHLPMVSAPFADFTWRHARRRAAADPTIGRVDETAIARTLDELLTRAGQGPTEAPADADDRRVAARTRAAAEARPPVPLAETADDGLDDDPDDEQTLELTDGHEDNVKDEELATVIPFGVFDAHAEARRWP
ncbi:Mu transposase C-terminal domain-containing protein [Pseudonocardia sp. RS11V-5]|uniref:Mu transposase C-terminal domain-containing protein n=1 Tax=Pseudonocardia terrae TaxID=2905831 RepID=UPI001E4B6612|nr:Mu transposase C-terminal domain-containing protein [Pseudonocardia terrae]MCE3551949.1 Mu transposase C-terminal domain-containing protein [Pseudonocardia terrae]